MVGLCDVGRCSASCRAAKMILIRAFRGALRVSLPQLSEAVTLGVITISSS